MASLPLLQDSQTRKFVHNGLTIEGYSRAPLMTYWRISEYKLGFDLGWQPWDFMGTPRWFISHTHMDHILALPAYLARRRMMLMDPPTIYLPAQKVQDLKMLLGAYTRLEQGTFPCEIVGVSPGDTIELSRELVVTVGKTFHKIPSVSYIVWERRKKLKEEYQGLSGDELRDLRLNGTEISRELRLPKVAYLGDSSIRGLDMNPDMFNAEILITEMTFTAEEHAFEMAGHIHLDDIVKRREQFKNQLIIASHFSVRYHRREILQAVQKKLPDMLDNRLKLWL